MRAYVTVNISLGREGCYGGSVSWPVPVVPVHAMVSEIVILQ